MGLHMWGRGAWGSFALAAMLSSTANAECLPLSLAVSKGIEASPLVLEARENSLVSESRLDITRSRWKPRVSAFANTQAGDNGFGQTQVNNSAGLRASQRIFDFGAASLERQAAELETRETEFRYLATQSNEALDISLTYIDALEALSTLQALNTRKVFLEENEAALTEMLELGAATRSDMAEARSELARAIADITQARFNLQSALSKLETLLRTRPDVCDLKSTKLWLEHKYPDDMDAQTLLRRAVKQDPIISAELARAERLGVNRETARRSRLPVLEVVGTSAYGYDRFAESWRLRNQIGVEVNVPLLTGGQQKASLSVAAAEARGADFRAQSRRRDLQERVLVTISRLQNFEDEISARLSARDAAKEQMEAITAEYEARAKSFSELIDARLNYEGAVLKYIEAEHNYVRQLAFIVNWTDGLTNLPAKTEMIR